MKTQLLCSFTNKRNLEQTIADINKHFTIVYEKIYVLQNEEKNHELVCTYNVECNAQLDFTLVSKTISLHRKKLTNTLYTINALRKKKAQIVITCKEPPTQMQSLSSGLCGKLESGLTVDIGMPDNLTKVEILERKAKEHLDCPDACHCPGRRYCKPSMSMWPS